MTDKERIGIKLANVRENLKLSQQKLADKSGFTRTTISKIEAGRYNASVELLSKMLRPIGYQIDIVKAAD